MSYFAAQLMTILLASGLAGCSGLKVEGACSWERTVTLSYQCEPDGKIEHIKIFRIEME